MIKNVEQLSSILVTAIKSGYLYAKMEDYGNDIEIDSSVTDYISLTIANTVLDAHIASLYKQ